MNKNFKLKKVLDYRHRLLENEKRILAELLHKESEILKQLNSIDLLIGKKMVELVEEQDFSFRSMYEKYINDLKHAKSRVLSLLEKHRLVIDKQKSKTLLAYKDKEVLEKLKENHIVAYNSYTNKQEVLITEDIVMTRRASEVLKDGDM